MTHPRLKRAAEERRRRVESLAEQFGIDDVERLDRALHDAEAAYSFRGRLDGGDVEATRAELARAADHLQRALSILSDDFVELEVRAHELGADSSPEQIDAAIDRYDERLRTLEELRRLTRAASEDTPARRGKGRPSKRWLRCFVRVLADYWQDELGRRLSVRFDNAGQEGLVPVSQDAYFMVEAARACGLGERPSEIRHAMRKSRD